MSITVMAGSVNYACSPLKCLHVYHLPRGSLVCAQGVFVFFISQFCIRAYETYRVFIVQTETHQGKEPHAKQPWNALGSAVDI